jgi:endogenous inhibitor of DNA gyrase (YacG/DUF329 family)
MMWPARNVYDETKKCPTCGDSVVVVLDEGRVRFPVCNKRLRGESAGYWD